MYRFIYLFISGCAGSSLPHRLFSSCGEQGCSLVSVHEPLIEVASLAVEHGSRAHGLRQLQPLGSVVAVHGLSCSTACGIFLDEGLNLCPLNWQLDS